MRFFVSGELVFKSERMKKYGIHHRCSDNYRIAVSAGRIADFDYFWRDGCRRTVSDSDGIIFHCEFNFTAHDEADKREIFTD